MEVLAEWYLKRIGRVVLPRWFVGVAFGQCHVIYDQERNKYTVLPLWADSVGTVICLNQTVLMKESHDAP